MKSKVIAIFALTTTMLFGVLASSHADDVTPYANIKFSNFRPNTGDPIAVYLELFNCSSFPTEISVNLFNTFDNDPFATLTKSTSGYKVKKVGNVYKVQWLYRGPTGDGVSNSPVGVSPDAKGGCVTDSEQFRNNSEWNMWVPSSVNWSAFLGVYNFTSFPDVNGLSLQWQPNDRSGAEPSTYFEIQYAISETQNWSRSFVTRDWNYKLRGLTKGVIYDLRIRTGSKNGVSEWTNSNYQASLRTPASFLITSKKSDGTTTRTFDAGDTVKIEMQMNDCIVEPSIQQWNGLSGSLDYKIFASDSRTQEQFSPIIALAGSEGFIYDSVLRKYEGSFEIPNLPNGTYSLESYLLSYCGWTYGPGNLGGYPYGNKLEFTVGPKSSQIPQWGETANYGFSGVDVIAQTSTSATLTWSRPENIEDGPFTYTVERMKPNGTVLKVLGSTKNYSFTVGGLSPGTEYEFRVLASNSATTIPSMRPSATISMRTGNLTVKRGSKLSAAAYAKAVGVVVPSGAKVTIAKPSGTFLFTNCKFAKNTVTFTNAVGACSVKLTIKPKKIKKTQPRSLITYHDVMIKR